MAKASSRLGRGLGSLIAGGTAAKAEDVSSSNPTLSPISIKKESIKNSPDIVDRDLTNDSDEENLFSIPIESIVPNPYQPRKVIDPDAIRELASSIESEGLLQPITARKVGDSYELVAGEDCTWSKPLFIWLMSSVIFKSMLFCKVSWDFSLCSNLNSSCFIRSLIL